LQGIAAEIDDMERHQVLRHVSPVGWRPGGLLTADHPRCRKQDALFEPISSSSQIYRRVDASEISAPRTSIARHFLLSNSKGTLQHSLE